MYVAPAFREDDLAALHGTMRDARLASLVTATAEGMTATPLPLFMRPDAYVSPSWYPSELEHQKVVPTWNYVAVHAYGPVKFFEEADRLLKVVTRLTNLHEQSRAKSRAVTDAPENFIRAQLKGIVGLRLPITRLEGKRKMSQNRSAEDRAGVAAELAASDQSTDRAVAVLIPN